MSALAAAPVRTIAAPQRPSLRVVAGDRSTQRPMTQGLAPASAAQAWRRRVGTVLVLASVLVLLVVGTMSAASGTAGGDVLDVTPITSATVVVQPGQTLWQLASEHAPVGTSTNAYLDAMIATNGLDGPILQAWQVLVLPAG